MDKTTTPALQAAIGYFLTKLPTELGIIADLADEAQERYGTKMRTSSFVAKIKKEYPDRYAKAFQERKEYRENALEAQRKYKTPQGRYWRLDNLGYTVLMTREQLAARGFIKLDK